MLVSRYRPVDRAAPHRDHLVIGAYALKGGKLPFRTDGPLLASDARHAMAAGRSFTVALTGPDGLKEVTGKVLSVELVEGVKPAQWEIALRVS